MSGHNKWTTIKHKKDIQENYLKRLQTTSHRLRPILGKKIEETEKRIEDLRGELMIKETQKNLLYYDLFEYLGKLRSERNKDVIRLRYIEGMNPKDISEVLGIELVQVYKRCRRGFDQLSEE